MKRRTLFKVLLGVPFVGANTAFVPAPRLIIQVNNPTWRPTPHNDDMLSTFNTTLERRTAIEHARLVNAL